MQTSSEPLSANHNWWVCIENSLLHLTIVLRVSKQVAILNLQGIYFFFPNPHKKSSLSRDIWFHGSSNSDIIRKKWPRLNSDWYYRCFTPRLQSGCSWQTLTIIYSWVKSLHQDIRNFSPGNNRGIKRIGSKTIFQFGKRKRKICKHCFKTLKNQAKMSV